MTHCHFKHHIARLLCGTDSSDRQPLKPLPENSSRRHAKETTSDIYYFYECFNFYYTCVNPYSIYRTVLHSLKYIEIFTTIHTFVFVICILQHLFFFPSSVFNGDPSVLRQAAALPFSLLYSISFYY